MRTTLIACTAWMILGQVSGCANFTTPPPAPQLTPAQRDFESLWLASLRTLREYHFTVDRSDRRAGVIETLPMLGQQWVEFWRQDAVTGYDLLENSLQGVTRRATVRIVGEGQGPATRPGAAAPASGPAGSGRYRLVVEVTVARGAEEISITRTTDGYDMFIIPGREEQAHRHMLERGLIPQEPGEEPPAPQGRVIAKDNSLANRLARDIHRAAEREYAKLK